MALYSNESNFGGGASPRGPNDGRVRRSKTQAIAFMLVALTTGIAAAWLITRVLAKRNTPGAVQMTKIAVAALDLPLATTISQDMVTFVDWPTQVLPPGYAVDAAKVVGRVPACDIVKGEPLVESRLASSDAGLGMAAVIPSTHRAMAVLVNEVIGVAGFIHPNDLVDVITTMPPVPGSQEIRSKIVLQNIRVMAVGQEMVTQDQKPVKVPVVTLLVTPAESERLALASAQGKLQLTLRSRADRDEVTTAGVSPPELFGRTLATRAESKPTRAARAAERPAPKSEDNVVEVLHGDRLEERKLRSKETP
jgi:pilus assembly protein CpaB